MEMEESKGSVFDQWGAESHRDVTERLVLCGGEEEAQRQRDFLNERFEM